MKLSISCLSKQYRRDFWALRDFDLELGPGVIGLLGPNGAGKYTLMRMSLTVLICTTRSRLMCTRHDRPYMYHA